MNPDETTTPAPVYPTTITFTRDGYTLRLDEDGLALQTHRNGYEPAEVIAMIADYRTIDAQTRTGFPAPQRPADLPF